MVDNFSELMKHTSSDSGDRRSLKHDKLREIHTYTYHSKIAQTERKKKILTATKDKRWLIKEQ